MINRNDMLELTRRMNLKGTHFTRIAGCYVDSEGEFDGSFNRAFGDLSASDRLKHLTIAKAVPFGGTNQELNEVRFPGDSRKNQDLWKLLMGIRSCGLKNDAMLDTFYDIVMESIPAGSAYSILFFHGVYDIPGKSSDGERLGESESVYEYMICTICPISGEYESGTPYAGFLFPAYAGQCADLDHIDVFMSSKAPGGVTPFADLFRKHE